jgi:RNA polymerase-binding transcription factor DksA
VDEAIAARLARRRDETLAQIEALTRSLREIIDAAADVATDDEHDPEGHTIAFERAQVAALLGEARSRLADLDLARARLAAGAYGRCERCGQPIAPGRLDARPAARTCITCAGRRD